MCFLLAVYDSYGNIKLCRLTPQVHINNLCLIQLTSDGRLLNGSHFSVLFLALQFCICYVLVFDFSVFFYFSGSSSLNYFFPQLMTCTARKEGYGWNAGTGVYLDCPLLLFRFKPSYAYSCF